MELSEFRDYLLANGFIYNDSSSCSCDNKWEKETVDSVVRVRRYSFCDGQATRGMKCPPEIEAYRDGVELFRMQGIPDIEEFEKNMRDNKL